MKLHLRYSSNNHPFHLFIFFCHNQIDRWMERVRERERENYQNRSHYCMQFDALTFHINLFQIHTFTQIMVVVYAAGFLFAFWKHLDLIDSISFYWPLFGCSPSPNVFITITSSCVLLNRKETSSSFTHIFIVLLVVLLRFPFFVLSMRSCVDVCLCILIYYCFFSLNGWFCYSSIFCVKVCVVCVQLRQC